VKKPVRGFLHFYGGELPLEWGRKGRRAKTVKPAGSAGILWRSIEETFEGEGEATGHGKMAGETTSNPLAVPQEKVH